MENLIVIGAVALLLAMLLNASAPAPQPPRIVVVQQAAEPEQSQGCLGIILGIMLFVALASLLGQVAG